jgi:hypothetical protein
LRIVVGSAFRNAAGAQVSRWMSQVAALRRELRDHYYCAFRAVAVEGDSRDSTREQLISEAQGQGVDLTLVTCNHGGPHYGSTEQPERMAALSMVGNAILDAVVPEDDVLVYVESDLIWEPETIRRLVDHVLRPNGEAGTVDPNTAAHVYAPLTMAADLFYDIWGVRDLKGNRFSPFPPFHHGLNGVPMEVGSLGSCLVMPARAARDVNVRMRRGALVEWSGFAREAGYRLMVCPDLKVRHPA